jgi:hypothetical protein
MKLEQQVCSLDLAKRLKELGVKQSSFLYWFKYTEDRDCFLNVGLPTGAYNGSVHDHHAENWRDGEIWSAFTVAELGEMLSPTMVEGKRFWFSDTREARSNATFMINEANSRAEMLIYLLENKLIAS